jgi:glucose-6-phosphate 1-dehydrogenase
MSGSALSSPSSPHEDLEPAGAHKAPPATMVIFGAHGDLTKRLLMPALYDLAASELLDEGFKIIGVDLAEGDTASWNAELTHTMQSFTQDPNAEFYVEKIDEKVWGWVQHRLTYLRADFTKADDMAKVKAAVQGSAVFYFAVAARFFGPLADGLGNAGLLEEAEGTFRRVVIEKPFGEDLSSAKALNARVLSHASEKQVFRIDHFLGKETVQNIMALRFGNGIFEPMWRRDHIDYVEITASETIGVEGRGKFYEPTGALRDMVPNHLFQLLSMVAMEAPNSFDAEAVRDEKAKVLKAIHPVSLHDVVRGQYEAGSIAGKQVPAYRNEPDVARGSKTETYIALQLNVDNWRWAGVPFYLRTGKRMAARQTEVVIHFRRPPFTLFRGTDVNELEANVLTLTVQPHEGMRLKMSAKHPGPKMVLAPIELKFNYEDAFSRKPNVGYETLIYDCLIGDPTLFQRADMIEASWAVVDGVLHGQEEPEIYASGSQGPKCAEKLLARQGHTWKTVSNQERKPNG